MSETTGYNGWSNYETWLVSLWLNNDQASYNALVALKAGYGSVNLWFFRTPILFHLSQI